MLQELQYCPVPTCRLLPYLVAEMVLGVYYMYGAGAAVGTRESLVVVSMSLLLLSSLHSPVVIYQRIQPWVSA